MIDEETQTRLDQYIEAYEAALRRVQIEQVAVALVQETAKDTRTGRIQQERRTGTPAGAPGQNLPATAKQIAFLQRLGVDVPQHLSKAEASAMIDEAQARAAA